MQKGALYPYLLYFQTQFHFHASLRVKLSLFSKALQYVEQCIDTCTVVHRSFNCVFARGDALHLDPAISGFGSSILIPGNDATAYCYNLIVKKRSACMALKMFQILLTC